MRAHGRKCFFRAVSLFFSLFLPIFPFALLSAGRAWAEWGRAGRWPGGLTCRLFSVIASISMNRDDGDDGDDCFVPVTPGGFLAVCLSLLSCPALIIFVVVILAAVRCPSLLRARRPVCVCAVLVIVAVVVVAIALFPSLPAGGLGLPSADRDRDRCRDCFVVATPGRSSLSAPLRGYFVAIEPGRSLAGGRLRLCWRQRLNINGR